LSRNSSLASISREPSRAPVSREPSMMSGVEIHDHSQEGGEIPLPSSPVSAPIRRSEPLSRSGGISMTIRDYGKQLPVGRLPPVDVCKKEKSALELIPIREIELTIPKAWHRHFFAKVLTTNPDTIDRLTLQPDIDTNPIDPATGEQFTYITEKARSWHFCRVKTIQGRPCSYHKPGSRGSGLRTSHVERAHPDIYMALMKFRASQGFQGI
jgi:hypothetical protein